MPLFFCQVSLIPCKKNGDTSDYPASRMPDNPASEFRLRIASATLLPNENTQGERGRRLSVLHLSFESGTSKDPPANETHGGVSQVQRNGKGIRKRVAPRCSQGCCSYPQSRKFSTTGWCRTMVLPKNTISHACLSGLRLFFIPDPMEFVF